MERTRYLRAALDALDAGRPALAAGHLSAGVAEDALPRLIAAALAAQREGDGDLPDILARARRLLEAEECQLSRKDCFALAALQGLLAGDGRVKDAGEAAVEIAEEALDALDGTRWTLTFEPPPRRNGAA
jgi:hypothetical protein